MRHHNRLANNKKWINHVHVLNISIQSKENKKKETAINCIFKYTIQLMSVIKRVGPKYRDILLLVFVCVCVRLHLACSVWKIKIDCFFFTYSRHRVKLLSWSLLIHLRHYYVYKWTFIVILNTVISDNFVFLDGRIRFFFLHESFCPELSRIVWLIDRCGCVAMRLALYKGPALRTHPQLNVNIIWCSGPFPF